MGEMDKSLDSGVSMMQYERLMSFASKCKVRPGPP